MSSLLSETSGLIAFVRTVETGTFSAAARDLGTTPSATSKSVARLERQLGSKLFLRSTRSLTLTPEGQAFFDRLAPLLHEIEQSADVLHPSTEPRGRLRISLPSEIARLLMDAILADFMNRYPLVDLDIGMTDRYVDVIREDYDVVFRIGRMEQSDLTVRTLAQLDMALVASRSFLDKWGPLQTMEELRNAPFVGYAMGRRTHQIRFADGTTIAARGRIGFDGAFGLLAAARHGLGIAHVTRCIAEEDIRAGKLVLVMPDKPLPAAPFQVLHAFGRQTPRRVQLFAGFVEREINRLTRLQKSIIDRMP
jgi:DNA-binding transcriptional LysR family regulator